jgi:YD repeat-containing protein
MGPLKLDKTPLHRALRPLASRAGAIPLQSETTGGRVTEYEYAARARILRRMDSTGNREIIEKLCREGSFFGTQVSRASDKKKRCHTCQPFNIGTS